MLQLAQAGQHLKQRLSQSFAGLPDGALIIWGVHLCGIGKQRLLTSMLCRPGQQHIECNVAFIH